MRIIRNPPSAANDNPGFMEVKLCLQCAHRHAWAKEIAHYVSGFPYSARSIPCRAFPGAKTLGNARALCRGREWVEAEPRRHWPDYGGFYDRH
jgi:hypothetical protein